jgi:hypothetical protein
VRRHVATGPPLQRQPLIGGRLFPAHLRNSLFPVLAENRAEELLGGVFEPVPDRWVREPIAPPIIEVAAGSFRRRNPPYVRGTGYVVRSLEGGADCRQPWARISRAARVWSARQGKTSSHAGAMASMSLRCSA